jgi:hypothetical protein
MGRKQASPSGEKKMKAGLERHLERKQLEKLMRALAAHPNPRMQEVAARFARIPGGRATHLRALLLEMLQEKQAEPSARSSPQVESTIRAWLKVLG